jgi:hypothetical protein
MVVEQKRVLASSLLLAIDGRWAVIHAKFLRLESGVDQELVDQCSRLIERLCLRGNARLATQSVQNS